jgi:spermidine synthase
MKAENNTARLHTILLIIFFFSGIAGLAYQILWVKLLSQMFGHTIYAISTVVATFMAGLALGSYIFGRLADRSKSPLKLYALLELGIGIYAILFISLFPLLNDLYILIFRFLNLGFSTFSLSRFIYAFIILIVPTALIGGTFPVMARYYIRGIGEIKKDTGFLYAINTLGAVTGALLTGFALLEWLGISATNMLMVAINISLALITWWIGNRQSETLDKEEKKDEKNDINFILIIYAFSGFVSLALEVLWTRELSIVFLSSTYSFSTVLITYLIGLTVGSMYFARKKINTQNAITYFYRIEYGIAIMALISIPLLRYLPQELYIQAVVAEKITWQLELILNFVVSFLVLIIPTFLMGAAFPLVCLIYTRSMNRIGDDLGHVYAMNTTGAIFGSLIAGFILIPQFGVINSISIISVVAFMIVAAIIIKYTSFNESRLEHLVLAIIFVGLFFVITIKGNGFRPLAQGTQVLYSKDDISAEVKVLKDETGNTALYINEKQQGGTRVMQTERWTGQIPLVFHNKPDSILLIGLGTGVTLNAISEGPVEHVTCVDLIGSLVEAADQFKNINGNILQNREKVTFIEADGINYLNLLPVKYDIIICDIVHPDDAGAGDLYSQEFYQSSLKGLKKNGLFVQWVLLDQLALDDLKTILATFLSVYPNMQIYLGHEQTRYQKLMLLGAADNSLIGFETISENIKKLSFVNEFHGKEDPFSFLSFIITNGVALKDNLGSIKLNSRDHPIIEYNSPKNKWLAGNNIYNLDFLNKIRKPVHQQIEVDSSFTILLDQYFTARSYLIAGRLEEMTGNIENADISYSRAALIDVDTLLVSNLLENVAWKFIEQKQFEMAITSFKKAIAVNHYNSKASYALAELYSQLKKEDEALEFYRYTVHKNHDHYNAYRRLGDLYSKKKEFEAAYYYYRMSLDINYNQPIIHYIIGQINLNYKKDYPNAARRFQISLELDPYHRYSSQARQALKKFKIKINKPR